MRRVVILGGGFGGVYTAHALEQLAARRNDVEILLVSEENYLLFTPMLHEIAGAGLNPFDVITPIRNIIKKSNFFCGSVESIDLNRRSVRLVHGASRHAHEVEYDHLVVALGSVSSAETICSDAANVYSMKSVSDALTVRNQVLQLLEEANFECCADIRQRLLSCCVIGAGFAGVETVAALQDLATRMLPHYPNLKESDLKFSLICSGAELLPELDAELGKYSRTLLESRGVKVLRHKRFKDYKDFQVQLDDGTCLSAQFLVWTAGNKPAKLVEQLDVPKERGRLLATECLQIPGLDAVWSLGDCAAVQKFGEAKGEFHPPTAQHAIRQARVLARNIINSIDGKDLKPFHFKTIGQLASLGRRRGVAQILGFKFSGRIAWLLWLCIYVAKLPDLSRRVRTITGLLHEMIFGADGAQLPVEFKTVREV